MGSDAVAHLSVKRASRTNDHEETGQVLDLIDVLSLLLLYIRINLKPGPQQGYQP